MRKISFWNRPLRRGKSSGLPLAVALVVAGCALPVRAGVKVPEWLAQAARQPTPAWIPKDAKAVALYSERQTRVNPDGAVETLVREAYRILRPEGRDFGQVQVYFSNKRPLKSIEGWCIPSEGKPLHVGRKEAVEMSGGTDWELYDDARAEVLTIPAADPGNVVGYEYVKKGAPLISQDEWWFQERVPVLDARYSLSIPGGWNFAAYWANHAPVEPASDGPGEYVWELHNIPAVAIEDHMPDWGSIAGRMAVKYDAPGNQAQVEQAGSWRAMGLWYDQLTAGSRDPTPAIRQQVAALTVGESTPLDQIRAIATYVQQNIRYVAIEIGVGGYQPHPAGQVFTNQYGDCKDKATLLSSMLAVIGVKSYYAVAQTDRGVVRSDFPLLTSFDHMILAIQLPAGTKSGLFATVNDPKLGKLLFFDPTDEYTPFGYLPSELQDNRVLLVTPGGGELVHLPLVPPTANRLMRMGTFTLEPNGSLSGSVEEMRWGGPAATGRARYLEADPADRGKIINGFLGEFLDSFNLLSASLGNLNQANSDLGIQYRFVAQDYASVEGNLVLLRPAVLGGRPAVPAIKTKRKYPVELPGTLLETDDFRITLPPGYTVGQLPPPATVDGGAISYRSAITEQGNVLEYKSTYIVNQVVVPTSELSRLRAADEQIAADQGINIVLHQTTN
ncbi:MAG TPA: DUF3857 and transglutaminase domain-containing protein [Patescibacteria group bacterium]|nr:DUF3857 and transglutaminase domain-containing protein [Patescibacteria group bacterium]